MVFPQEVRPDAWGVDVGRSEPSSFRLLATKVKSSAIAHKVEVKAGEPPSRSIPEGHDSMENGDSPQLYEQLLTEPLLCKR